MPIFHVFLGVQAKLFGFPLEYLDEWASFGKVIKFLNFGTYFRLIAREVRARESPKVKKSKLRVTRKPDLETQNWVYSFSSFIEPYQTHIVTAQMLFDCWTVLIHNFFFFLECRFWAGTKCKSFLESSGGVKIVAVDCMDAQSAVLESHFHHCFLRFANCEYFVTVFIWIFQSCIFGNFRVFPG
jgi:hypothetical protein